MKRAWSNESVCEKWKYVLLSHEHSLYSKKVDTSFGLDLPQRMRDSKEYYFCNIVMYIVSLV